MAQGASSLRRLPTYINHQKTGNYSSQKNILNTVEIAA